MVLTGRQQASRQAGVRRRRRFPNPTCMRPFSLPRACDDGTQAKAVLAVTATFFAVVALTLLARTWGVGAGVVSKIKIFVTHFQVEGRCV